MRAPRRLSASPISPTMRRSIAPRLSTAPALSSRRLSMGSGRSVGSLAIGDAFGLGRGKLKLLRALSRLRSFELGEPRFERVEPRDDRLLDDETTQQFEVLIVELVEGEL